MVPPYVQILFYLSRSGLPLRTWSAFDDLIIPRLYTVFNYRRCVFCIMYSILRMFTSISHTDSLVRYAYHRKWVIPIDTKRDQTKSIYLIHVILSLIISWFLLLCAVSSMMSSSNSHNLQPVLVYQPHHGINEFFMLHFISICFSVPSSQILQ